MTQPEYCPSGPNAGGNRTRDTFENHEEGDKKTLSQILYWICITIWYIYLIDIGALFSYILRNVSKNLGIITEWCKGAGNNRIMV